MVFLKKLMIPPSVGIFLPIKMKNMQNSFPALVSGALLPYPMVVAWKGFHIDSVRTKTCPRILPDLPLPSTFLGGRGPCCHVTYGWPIDVHS